MRTILNLIFGGTNYPGAAGNLGLLLGRLGFGLLIALLHGVNKLPPSESFITGVAELGFPAAIIFAWAAALAEFAGGLLLALGLATRPAALMVAVTMAVAAFLRHAADPLDVKELALAYLSFALLFVFAGAGKYSLDWLIMRRRG